MKHLPNRAICIAMILAFTPRSGAQDALEDAKPVEVAEVVEVEVKAGQRVVGTVMPLRTSTVGSAVDGRVEKLLVNQGEAVREGQAVAQLLTNTLEIELKAAQAERRLFQFQLEELENGSRPEDIAEAQANMMSAKASMQNATSRLKRMQSLASSRAASTAELDEAQQQFDAAKFSVEASKALLDRIESGPRREAISQAKARVELQTERCHLLEDRIAKFTIRAPFDGYVSAKFTEVGAWISQGDPIVQVIQLDEVEVQTPVTAEHAVHLQRGDPVRVEFPELPEHLFTGTVERLVPIADRGARTYPVILRMKNVLRAGNPLLLAGMMARVHLPSGSRQTLPLVPKDALVLNADERALYVVDVAPGGSEGSERFGTVRKVPVQLGVAHGAGIQVKGEVRKGDLVVVVGNERLLPNAKVRIIGSQGTLAGNQ